MQKCFQCLTISTLSSHRGDHGHKWHPWAAAALQGEQVLSNNSFITSWKSSVQNESLGGQMTWAWHGGPVPSLQQGTTSCSLFTRVRQHDVCPLSNQRSASQVSNNNSSSCCLGLSIGITVWLEAEGQAQSCTSALYPPGVYLEIVLAALFRTA